MTKEQLEARATILEEILDNSSDALEKECEELTGIYRALNQINNSVAK